MARDVRLVTAMPFVVFRVLRAIGRPPRPPIELVVTLAGIVGFVIGRLIPTWDREAPRQRDRIDGAVTERRRPRRPQPRRRARRHAAGAGLPPTSYPAAA
jgi:hypothetical protein